MVHYKADPTKGANRAFTEESAFFFLTRTSISEIFFLLLT